MLSNTLVPCLRGFKGVMTVFSFIKRLDCNFVQVGSKRSKTPNLHLSRNSKKAIYPIMKAVSCLGIKGVSSVFSFLKGLDGNFLSLGSKRSKHQIFIYLDTLMVFIHKLVITRGQGEHQSFSLLSFRGFLANFRFLIC